jgi:flagellar hook-length control protein FliK
MDLNIASINTSSDASNFLAQQIESQEDFSKIIQNQVQSLSGNTVELNPEINDDSHLCLEEAEKNGNLNGKPLPANFNKKASSDVDREVNDSIICMYNPIVQNLPSKPISEYIEPNIKLFQTLQDSLDSTSKSEIELSANTAENKQFVNDENKTSIQIENTAPDLNLKKIAIKDQTSTPILNNSLTFKKLNIENKATVSQDEFIPFKEDPKINEEVGLSNLQNLSVTSDSKVKIKNQSQSLSMDLSSENIDLSKLESSNGALDIPEMETAVIEYDSNNALNFEKELGERLVTMIKENDHDVTLKIDPPELGKMDIKLQISENEANLSFYTTNLQVKSAIESSLNDLRTLFSQQALSLGDVNVFHQGSEGSKNPHQERYESREMERLEGLSNIRPPKNSSEGKISVFV